MNYRVPRLGEKRRRRVACHDMFLLHGESIHMIGWYTYKKYLIDDDSVRDSFPCIRALELAISIALQKLHA